MSAIGGPNIVEDGLVLSLDAANIKSFRGPAQTNLLTGINYSISNTDTANFKVTNGTEVTNVPTRGIRTVKYVDIYNNQPDISCCPNLYNFGDITVTGSTQYTYSILYKTNTGYSHPNYMYRYEYNGGTYVTEAGVHSTSNRTDLGDGWYHAWGTFTTQASTNRLITYLFHYEYGTFNRVYVDSIQITQGSYIGVPQHMLEPAQVRGTTVATGGGWADRSGNSNHGELINGPTYSSANGGVIVLDGVNDYIDISLNLTNQNYTVMGAARYVSIGGRTFSGQSNNWLMGHWSSSTQNHFANGWVSGVGAGPSDTNWRLYATTGNFSGDSWALYVNGVLNAGPNGGGSNGPNGFSIGRYAPGNSEYSNSHISFLMCYNRILTVAEIQQNFSALKGRYGL